MTDGDGHFYLDSIDIGDPGPGDVLVEIRASGVCHTDFDSMSWGRRCVMGHEGAGVVLSCGDGVKNVRKGDHVLLNWAMPCGKCFQCGLGAEAICEAQPSVQADRVKYGLRPIERSFQLGTMATHTLVPFQAVTKLEFSMPFPSAAILGCGVMTGVGSVINSAQVQRASSVVVLGVGGVGLSVIQGSRLAGATMIIAVDLLQSRLDMARSFGATHAIQAFASDSGLLGVAETVRKLNGRGADYAFECTAVPALGAAPLAMVRNGGMAVAVSGIEEIVPIDMRLFEWNKTYINPLYGQCRPSVDFPLLMKLYNQGDLKLDEMITKTYPLSSLGDAFRDMKLGRNAKGVLLPHGN